MATGKGHIARSSYRFLPSSIDRDTFTDSAFEFDESDLYSNSARANSPEFRKTVRASSRLSSKSKSSSASSYSGGRPASVPMNVPDWSKILGQEYRENRRREVEEDDDAETDDGCEARVPPHEFLARTRMASFSVHEGIGRTLKGRDLSRVRNAIWAKTGNRWRS
ncbi:hypothetical protein Ahy_B08g094076 isoform B [Arachis hypogaea]|uniref:Senescence regulator n=1 Tax=Arachis hypogaea TaxID=3818 RepID=A0A444Y7R8_ARAHY|nr:hypothetical protein Ahy_B08g094076 isoform B [Arachis hypogaea]